MTTYPYYLTQDARERAQATTRCGTYAEALLLARQRATVSGHPQIVMEKRDAHTACYALQTVAPDLGVQ